MKLMVESYSKVIHIWPESNTNPSKLHDYIVVGTIVAMFIQHPVDTQYT